MFFAWGMAAPVAVVRRTKHTSAILPTAHTYVRRVVRVVRRVVRVVWQVVRVVQQVVPVVGRVVKVVQDELQNPQ